MTIYLATDHAGYMLKEAIKKNLQEQGRTVIDCGAITREPEDDYPDYISKAAQAISENPDNFAIVFGGSGQGEAMVANRFKGVRAAVWYGGSSEILKLSREHNNANVLSFGARFVSEQEAIEAVSLWLKTPFSNDERHKRRISKY